MKSYRDLWLWLGAAMLTASAGLLAIALAYFTKLPKYSLFTSWWIWAAIIVFALAFACFYSAIKGAAFPPWVRLGFPEIEIDMRGGARYGFPETWTDSPMGVKPFDIWVYRVHIINREKEQNASLIIQLFLELAPDSTGIPFAEMEAMPLSLPEVENFSVIGLVAPTLRMFCLKQFSCPPRLARQEILFSQ